MNAQYPDVLEALCDLPDGSVVDGEIIALDDAGKPDFNLLQNYRSAAARIHYFVFDLLVHQGHDIMGESLEERRKLLRSLEFFSPRIRLVDYPDATTAEEMLSAVKGLGLEGVIAKRRDSRYEPGKRSGAWVKCRVNKSQEFVIGGYFPGPQGFDSIIVSYYQGKDLMYVARTRNGFVPASRGGVFAKLKTAKAYPPKNEEPTEQKLGCRLRSASISDEGTLGRPPLGGVRPTKQGLPSLT